MVNWRSGGGVCLHCYLCILLYVKHSWCMVFHRSMVDWLFSVVVFQRSMVNRRRGWGLSALVSVHSAICEI